MAISRLQVLSLKSVTDKKENRRKASKFLPPGGAHLPSPSKLRMVIEEVSIRLLHVQKRFAIRCIVSLIYGAENSGNNAPITPKPHSPGTPRANLPMAQIMIVT